MNKVFLIIIPIILLALALIGVIVYNADVMLLLVYVESMKLPIFSILSVGIFVISFILYIIINSIYKSIQKKYNDEEIYDTKNIDVFKYNFKKYDVIDFVCINESRLPKKKDIIAIILQLINKKLIQLMPRKSGDKYEYYVKMSENIDINTLKEHEILTLRSLFSEHDEINLLKYINSMYKGKSNNKIVESATNYIYDKLEINKVDEKSKSLINIFVLIITLLNIGQMLLMQETIAAIPLDSFGLLSLGIFLVIGLEYIFILISTMIFGRINKELSKTDNFTVFLVSNFIAMLLIGFIIYLVTIPLNTLVFAASFATIYIATAMIYISMQDTFVNVSVEYKELKKELIALKKYLKENSLVNQKELGQIFLYDEFITFAFIFNISINVNDELNVFQRELKSYVKEEYLTFKQIAKKLLDKKSN